jgi:hypothetical protein
MERVCRFEELEPRIALSATPGPEIVIGATYAEQSNPEGAGDRFEVAWVGGAPGTQLTQLTISGDQDGSGGLSIGDVFFDNTASAPGVNDFSNFAIHSDSDISAAQIQSMSITNGGTTLNLVHRRGRARQRAQHAGGRRGVRAFASERPVRHARRQLPGPHQRR